MINVKDMSAAQLARYIEDVVNRTRPQVPTNMTVEELVVNRLLTLGDELEIGKAPNFINVGSNGAPAFLNSWANHASGRVARFWKDPFGFVHLEGLIISGTVGAPAWRLPPGYWPAVDAGPFAVLSHGAVGNVTVGSNGDVVPDTPSSNVYVSLYGVSFKAA